MDPEVKRNPKVVSLPTTDGRRRSTQFLTRNTIAVNVQVKQVFMWASSGLIQSIGLVPCLEVFAVVLSKV